MIQLASKIQDKFTKVARILIDDKKVTFGFKGNHYSCEEKKDGSFHITFAVLSSDPSADLIKSLEGFLDHEIGHALFTKFGVLKNLDKKVLADTEGGKEAIPIIKSLLNIVEDFRIEKEMKKQYLGCKENIDFMNKFIHEKMSVKTQQLSGWPAIQITLNEILTLGQAEDTYAEVESYLRDKAGELLERVEDLESTQACLDWSIEFFNRLYEEQEDSPESSESSSDPEEGDASSETGGGSSTPNEGNNNPEEGSKKSPSLGNLSDSLPDSWKEGILQDENSRIDTSKEGPQLPRPYTREYDSVSKSVLPSNYPYEIDNKVSFYANKLSSVIRSETITGWERGLNRGKLDTNALYRLTTDSNVFKKKNNPRIDMDVVFCIGVDNSDSMPRVESHEILTNIFEILGRVGIPFEVFTYTSLCSRNKIGVDEDQYKIVSEIFSASGDIYKDLSFSRTLPLSISVLKDYQEDFRQRKNKLYLGPPGFTPTPEAFEYAILSLEKRSEKKKFFVNITDGFPQEHGNLRGGKYYTNILKNLMSMCNQKGIQYLNLGYNMDPSFKTLDPKVIITQGKNFLEDFVNHISLKMREKKLVK